MSKQRKTYSGSFKVRIVSELLAGRKTLVQLAEEYEVHPNQIKNWKSILLKAGEDILEDKRKRRRGPV